MTARGWEICPGTDRRLVPVGGDWYRCPSCGWVGWKIKSKRAPLRTPQHQRPKSENSSLVTIRYDLSSDTSPENVKCPTCDGSGWKLLRPDTFMRDLCPDCNGEGTTPTPENVDSPTQKDGDA